ncbi:MAG: hypothetical protein GBAus27B_000602 [Mycoplasmataceae bacterium]|nr:MAG: hypothetical protein GBAus27B_000602 [Mycoplasmataceae bacterium]
MNQDPAKAKGSAETYAIKYFLIPTDNNLDPDAFGAKEDSKDIAESLKKTPLIKPDLTNPIRATLTEIKTKLDKNNSKYLLLETDLLPNDIFVFHYKIEPTRWPQLIKNKAYHLSLEESSNGLLTLLDFKEIC